MTRVTPTFGPTDEDVLRQSYEHGYEGFDHVDPDHLLPEDVSAETVLEHDDFRLSDYESVRVSVSEDRYMKGLWWALEDYYEEHKSEEEYQQFQREAAVAEDFDSAFRAGAYAALRGDPCDPEGDLPFFNV